MCGQSIFEVASKLFSLQVFSRNKNLQISYSNPQLYMQKCSVMVNHKDGILHFLMLSYNLQLLLHLEFWTSLVMMVAQILLHSQYAVCQSAHNRKKGHLRFCSFIFKCKKKRNPFSNHRDNDLRSSPKIVRAFRQFGARPIS